MVQHVATPHPPDPNTAQAQVAANRDGGRSGAVHVEPAGVGDDLDPVRLGIGQHTAQFRLKEQVISGQAAAAAAAYIR